MKTIIQRAAGKWVGAVIFALVTAGVLGYGSPVQAHRVNIFAWVQGDMVYTESKFNAGKTVRDGLVEVYDPQGKLLLSGKTDAAGAFSFKVPQHSDLRIVLKAAMGHQNEWLVRAEEIAPVAGAPAEAPAGLPDHPPAVPVMGGTDQTRATPAADASAMAQLLDQKLAPILKKLNQLQSEREPGLREILGGIGYILGLVGVGAYVQFRRREK